MYENFLGGDDTIYSLHCADGWFWAIACSGYEREYYRKQCIFRYSLYNEMEGRESRELYRYAQQLQGYAQQQQGFIPYHTILTASQTCKIMRAFKSADLVKVDEVPDEV